VVDEVASQQILGLRENGLKRLLEVRGVIRKTNDADLSAIRDQVATLHTRYLELAQPPRA